ncbi:MAG: ScpA family protein [Coriobacteriia bacterium]|nr:ScpA family protein [Coriobacteriia bacterium]
MATYKVRTEIFEGPFDLLLHLVGRQKLDIRDITVSEIADEFCAHIERMKDLDLDVASDFLLVAATLLEIKAAALFPSDDDPDLDEFDDLSPQEARELLVERLITYKQFKSVSGELAMRMEAEGRMHPRGAGLEEPFLKLMPDYLEGITLRGLAVVCADLEHRREVFLLQAEHVASMPVSLELHMEGVKRSIRNVGKIRFSELVPAGSSPEIVVVTFLAILELYKRGLVDVRQDALFGDIEITELEGGDEDE